MNGPEHYLAAEEHLAIADDIDHAQSADLNYQAAIGHALLALVACIHDRPDDTSPQGNPVEWAHAFRGGKP